MPRPQPFITLCEIHDRDTYKAVINSLGTNTTDENYKKELREYLKFIKANKIKVKYFYKLVGAKGEKYGRLYAEGGCFQTMPSNYRGHFCHTNYVGLDISNAHPNLINGLFKYYKIDCQEMDDYCNNRDEVVKKYGIPKSFVNSICNYELFPIDKEIKDENSEFFKKIKSAVYNSLVPKLIEDFSDLYSVSTQNKIEKNKANNKDEKYNIKGAFVANFLMTLENRIILQCYQTLKNDYSIDAIIHDEILIKKTDDIESVCDKLKNVVKNTNFLGIPFDFELNFKISKYEPYKPFQSALDEKKKEVQIAEEVNEEYCTGKKTDTEIAKELALLFYGKYFKYENDIYVYNENVWSNECDIIFKKWIVGCNVMREEGSKDGKRPPKYICDESSHLNHHVTQLKLYVLNIFETDYEKYNLLDNQKNIVPFLNGCYDLVNREFIEYEKMKAPYYFTKKILRKYKKVENYDTVRKILLDIFDTEDLMTEVLSYFMRALSGHVEDKLWLSMIGERNSGKGVLFEFLNLSFGTFVGTFNSGDIVLKNSYESAERKNGFLSNFVNCRLVISQEIPTDIKFDGTLIKTCSSGGDEVRFREAHGRVGMSKIKALMCVMGQSIPSIAPIDAFENSLICNMPCKFFLEDPKSDMKHGFKIKKADVDLKNKIPDLCDEFINYLFTFFCEKRPKYELMRESVNELIKEDNIDQDPYVCVMKYIKEKYVITNNIKDRINRSEFNKKIKSSFFQTATPNKLVTFMEANGFKSMMSSGIRYYCGLKEKSEESEFI